MSIKDNSNKNNDKNDNSNNTTQAQNVASRSSLGPVLERVDALRTAVHTAVKVHAAVTASAAAADAAVSPTHRAALESRRAALVEEVRVKNDRIALLIDHLRNLHRDSLSFLSTGSPRMTNLPAAQRRA